jgi:hypothetical protein
MFAQGLLPTGANIQAFKTSKDIGILNRVTPWLSWIKIDPVEIWANTSLSEFEIFSQTVTICRPKLLNICSTIP